jgi:hypothetical protein
MICLVVHVLEIHRPVVRALAEDGGGLPAALGVPDPAPLAPPGLSRPVDTVLAWGKWGVLVCGVAGLLVCGAKMAIGHRNRSTFAAEGASGIPWVLGGLSLAAVASAIVGVFLR